MTDKTGWQKGVRAAQEAKAAPEAMQRGLELSKARDRVPGGQGWLLTEAPWIVTEDAGGNSQFDFLCFCPSPGQVARQGDVKQHHFRLRCLLGNEVALPPFIPWAEQQTPVLPNFGADLALCCLSPRSQHWWPQPESGCPFLSAAPCKVSAAGDGKFLLGSGQ